MNKKIIRMYANELITTLFTEVPDLRIPIMNKTIIRFELNDMALIAIFIVAICIVTVTMILVL